MSKIIKTICKDTANPDRMDEAQFDGDVGFGERLGLGFVPHQSATEEDESQIMPQSAHNLTQKTAQISKIILR